MSALGVASRARQRSLRCSFLFPFFSIFSFFASLTPITTTLKQKLLLLRYKIKGPPKRELRATERSATPAARRSEGESELFF